MSEPTSPAASSQQSSPSTNTNTTSTGSSAGTRVSFFLPFGSRTRDQDLSGKEESLAEQNQQQQQHEESKNDDQHRQTTNGLQHHAQQQQQQQQLQHPLTSILKRPHRRPSDTYTMDLLTEYHQVEHYIQRLNNAFQIALATGLSKEEAHHPGEDSSLHATLHNLLDFADPSHSSSPTGSGSSTSGSGGEAGGGVSLCHISPEIFGDDPIQIPRPPPSLRLLEYQCEFDGVAIARELVQRRNELWGMIQQMERDRERREFDERMMILRLEIEKENAIEIKKLEHRLATS